MKFILSHKGEDRTLDWDSMPMPDAIACQKQTGMTYSEWRKSLLREDAEAIAFAWWIAGRRAGVDVGRYVDLLEDRDFDLGALQVEPVLTEEEQAAIDKVDEDGAAADEGPTGPEQEATPGE